MITTLQLIVQLYTHYVHISTRDLAANDAKLRELFNPAKPLKSLYTRLNDLVNYTAVAGETITNEQVIQITYGLVAETGQFQEYC